MGEPMRLMADMDESAPIVAVWPYAAGEKMLIATNDGRGFVVGEDDMLSSTRKGRQVMSVDAPAVVSLVVPAAGDHVATIGENRKMLIFPLRQIPEMARGKGVRLQRYKDGGISDARVFKLCGRPDLARQRGADVYGFARRAQGMDRQPRRSRPIAAQRVPEEQQVRRVAPGLRVAPAEANSREARGTNGLNPPGFAYAISDRPGNAPPPQAARVASRLPLPRCGDSPDFSSRRLHVTGARPAKRGLRRPAVVRATPKRPLA